MTSLSSGRLSPDPESQSQVRNLSNYVHKKTPDGVSEVVNCEVSSPPLTRPVEGAQVVEVAGVEIA